MSKNLYENNSLGNFEKILQKILKKICGNIQEIL